MSYNSPKLQTAEARSASIDPTVLETTAVTPALYDAVLKDEPVEGVDYITQPPADDEETSGLTSLEEKFTKAQLAYMGSRKQEYLTSTLKRRPHVTRSVSDKFIAEILQTKEVSPRERIELHVNVKHWFSQRARTRISHPRFSPPWSARKVFYRDNVSKVAARQRQMYDEAMEKLQGRDTADLDVGEVDLDLVDDAPPAPKTPSRAAKGFPKPFDFLQAALSYEIAKLNEEELAEYERRAIQWRAEGPPEEQKRRSAEKDAVPYAEQFHLEMFKHMGARMFSFISYKGTDGKNIISIIDVNNQTGAYEKFSRSIRPQLVTSGIWKKWASYTTNTHTRQEEGAPPPPRGSVLPMQLNEYGEPLLPDDWGTPPQGQAKHKHYQELIRSYVTHSMAAARRQPVLNNLPTKDQRPHWLKMESCNERLFAAESLSSHPQAGPIKHVGGMNVLPCEYHLSHWHTRQKEGKVGLVVHHYIDDDGETIEERLPRVKIGSSDVDAAAEEARSKAESKKSEQKRKRAARRKASKGEAMEKKGKEGRPQDRSGKNGKEAVKNDEVVDTVEEGKQKFSSKGKMKASEALEAGGCQSEVFDVDDRPELEPSGEVDSGVAGSSSSRRFCGKAAVSQGEGLDVEEPLFLPDSQDEDMQSPMGFAYGVGDHPLWLPPDSHRSSSPPLPQPPPTPVPTVGHSLGLLSSPPPSLSPPRLQGTTAALFPEPFQPATTPNRIHSQPMATPQRQTGASSVDAAVSWAASRTPASTLGYGRVAPSSASRTAIHDHIPPPTMSYGPDLFSNSQRNSPTHGQGVLRAHSAHHPRHNPNSGHNIFLEAPSMPAHTYSAHNPFVNNAEYATHPQFGRDAFPNAPGHSEPRIDASTHASSARHSYAIYAGGAQQYSNSNSPTPQRPPYVSSYPSSLPSHPPWPHPHSSQYTPNKSSPHSLRGDPFLASSLPPQTTTLPSVFQSQEPPYQPPTGHQLPAQYPQTALQNGGPNIVLDTAGLAQLLQVFGTPTQGLSAAFGNVQLQQPLHPASAQAPVASSSAFSVRIDAPSKSPKGGKDKRLERGRSIEESPRDSRNDSDDDEVLSSPTKRRTIGAAGRGPAKRARLTNSQSGKSAATSRERSAAAEKPTRGSQAKKKAEQPVAPSQASSSRSAPPAAQSRPHGFVNESKIVNKRDMAMLEYAKTYGAVSGTRNRKPKKRDG